jgi:hypothetical protein
MPSPRVDPQRLLALAAALEPLAGVARAGADEVLGHFPEIGDRTSQTSLDALLEQFADTLRALDAEATEQAARLRIAAREAAGRRATEGGAAERGAAERGAGAEGATGADHAPARRAGWPR